MTTYKTDQLEGVFLRAAVAEAHGFRWQIVGPISHSRTSTGCEELRCEYQHQGSYRWERFDPGAETFMEREGISVCLVSRAPMANRKIGDVGRVDMGTISEVFPESAWQAQMVTPDGREVKARGPSARVAIFRCLVAGKFGDEVTL